MKKMIAVFILLFLLLLCTSCNLWPDPKLSEAEQEFQQYLESKYQTEFIVENARYFTKSLGAPKEIVADVKWKEDPDVTFEISRFVENQEYSIVGKYADYFLKSLWSKQSRPYFQGFTERIFGHHVFVVSDVVVDDKLEASWSDGVIEFEEAIRKYPQQIICGITIFNISPSTEGNKQQDAEKLLQYIDLLDSKKIMNYDIGYYMYAPHMQKEIQDNLEKFAYPSSTLDIDKRKENNELLYYCILHEDEIKSIKKGENILKYFE